MQTPADVSLFALHPIARLASDYPDKFGVPRQPGLVATARGVVSFVAPYDDPLAFAGIAGYSHLWLSFVFDRSPETWRPRVRPPRLGGNARVGVFATRSTHRPNRLGLSLVRLLDVATFSQPTRAPWAVPGTAVAQRARTHVLIGGHDLVDGTPIVDIKPYLPWVEAPGDARADLAPAAPATLEVHFAAAALRVLDARPDGAALQTLIGEVLAQDPRPAYQKSAAGRRYGVALRDVDVGFVVEDGAPRGIVRVVSIEPRPAADDQPPM